MLKLFLIREMLFQDFAPRGGGVLHYGVRRGCAPVFGSFWPEISVIGVYFHLEFSGIGVYCYTQNSGYVC